MKRALATLTAAAALATAALTAPPSGAAAATEPTAPAPVAARYTATAGPIFANRNRAIFNRLIANTDNAPSGSTIRAMTMTFSDEGISAALIRAARRGVNVYVAVAAKACGEPAVNSLQAEEAKRSNIDVSCIDNGGRGTSGTQHIKGMSFSRTGSSSRVVVLTSSNFTKTAPSLQWNDAYQSVGWTKFYDFWNTIHKQIMLDRAITNPFRQMVDGVSRAYATPQNPGQADPVIQRINALPTRGLRIHIAQSAEHGTRGERIVKALVAKRRAGASVTYVYARPFEHRALLTAAGGRVKMVDPPDPNSFLHHKFMIASWINSAGQRVYRTWMGTEVWTDLAKSSDEMMLQLASKRTYDRYRAQITYLLGL